MKTFKRFTALVLALVMAAMLAVPQPLLEEAGIDPDGEVQVICIEGAIIIAEDSTLNEDELSEVVDRLRAANDLAQQFANEPDTTEGGTFHGSY